MNVSINPPPHASDAASTVRAKTFTIAAGKGNILLSVTVNNSDTSERYLQLFDLAVAPTTAVSIPSYPSIPVGAGQTIMVEALMGLLKSTLGLQAAISSTPDVYTELGSAKGWFHARYL